MVRPHYRLIFPRSEVLHLNYISSMPPRKKRGPVARMSARHFS